MVVGAVLAVILLVFRMAIETQLSRLHAPGETAFGYRDLHGIDASSAAKAWETGKLSLAAFEPVSARTLVLQRSSVAGALLVLTLVLLVILVVRLRRRWLLLFVVPLGASWLLTILVDLSLIEDPDRASATYASWRTWLDVVPWVCLGMIGLLVSDRVLAGSRSRWASYRASPASTRLVLFASVVVAGVFFAGDIGAQLEDILRRELATGEGGSPVWGAVRILGALAACGAIVVAASRLQVGSGRPPDSRSTAAVGAGIMVAGSLAMLQGLQSALFVLGLMVTAVALLSWTVDGRRVLPVRRRQLALRTVGIAAVAGVAMVVLGADFGLRHHGGLLFSGIGALFAATLIWWKTRRSEDRPVTPVVATCVVVAGLATITLWPPQRLGGALVAIIGLLWFAWTRLDFEPTNSQLPEWTGWAGIAPGLGFAYANADDALALYGVAAVAGGMAWLTFLRGSFAGEPPKPVTPLAETRGSGVLMVAMSLVAIALLTSSVRVLASELATGGPPPLVLLLFQAGVIVILGVVCRQLATPTTLRPEPSRRRTSVFVGVSLVPPAIALVSWRGDSGLATDVGRWLGPIAALIAAIVFIAATGGLLRRAFGPLGQPAIFRYLGFLRTPVVGLFLTWLLLIAVIGSPLERDTASSHLTRLDTSTTPLVPAPCEDDLGVVAAITASDPSHDTAVADELCRWMHDLMADRGAARESLPLVLVTASGGGVRAASWTMRVLDCLFFVGPPPPKDTVRSSPSETTCSTSGAVSGSVVDRIDRWDLIFAVGGASGGSVGLATATAERIAPVPNEDQRPLQAWARSIAQREHVSEVAGQMLFGELGLAVIGVVPEHDRAEVLIDGWAERLGPVVPARCPGLDDSVTAIAEVGFFELAAACPEKTPLLLFNGTVVRTGDRFDISQLAGSSPGYLSLRDVLCTDSDDGADIPLMDAAFLSARFPLVTPSGRIGYDRPDDCRPATATPVDVVDGGYHENSGTAQIERLWVALGPMIEAVNEANIAPQIQPVLLQIENGEVGAGEVRDCPQPPMPDPSYRVEAGEPDRNEPSEPPVVDASVRLGEPLRIPWAKAQDLRLPEENSKQRLIDSFCSQGLPAFTMALYEHPGRSVPLGWSMTDGLLDDMQKVFALEPNACRALTVVALLDSIGGPGSTSPTVRWPCQKTKGSDD